MYWMMIGANEERLALIKVVNIGHTADKNGVTRPSGPHTYRVECSLPAHGLLPGGGAGASTVHFTVTHKREDGPVTLGEIILKVLNGELKNAENNKDAEPFEIKRQP